MIFVFFIPKTCGKVPKVLESELKSAISKGRMAKIIHK